MEVGNDKLSTLQITCSVRFSPIPRLRALREKICQTSLKRVSPVEPLTKFSKKGGLTGPQLLEGGCWESGGGVTFFRRGCNFHIKTN